jgi:hypothetical protein
VILIATGASAPQRLQETTRWFLASDTSVTIRWPDASFPSSTLVTRELFAVVHGKKKPTRQNTLRCSIASAYLLTNHSAQAGLLFIQSSVGVERGGLNSPPLIKRDPTPFRRNSNPVILCISEVITIQVGLKVNDPGDRPGLFVAGDAVMSEEKMPAKKTAQQLVDEFNVVYEKAEAFRRRMEEISRQIKERSEVPKLLQISNTK